MTHTERLSLLSSCFRAKGLNGLGLTGKTTHAALRGAGAQQAGSWPGEKSRRFKCVKHVKQSVGSGIRRETFKTFQDLNLRLSKMCFDVEYLPKLKWNEKLGTFEGTQITIITYFMIEDNIRSFEIKTSGMASWMCLEMRRLPWQEWRPDAWSVWSLHRSLHWSVYGDVAEIPRPLRIPEAFKEASGSRPWLFDIECNTKICSWNA